MAQKGLHMEKFFNDVHGVTIFTCYSRILILFHTVLGDRLQVNGSLIYESLRIKMPCICLLLPTTNLFNDTQQASNARKSAQSCA